jgi:hypothetical protein
VFRNTVKLNEEQCLEVLNAFSAAQSEGLMGEKQSAVARLILYKFPRLEKYYYYLKDPFGEVPDPNLPADAPKPVDTSIIDEIFSGGGKPEKY